MRRHKSCSTTLHLTHSRSGRKRSFQQHRRTPQPAIRPYALTAHALLTKQLTMVCWGKRILTRTSLRITTLNCWRSQTKHGRDHQARRHPWAQVKAHATREDGKTLERVLEEVRWQRAISRRSSRKSRGLGWGLAGVCIFARYAVAIKCICVY